MQSSFLNRSAILGYLLTCVGILYGTSSPIFAQATDATAHHHDDSASQAAKAPKVFLDKSPKIVEYQLKRLSNAELLQVERSTDHVKYLPVFSAILVRPGIAVGERIQAAESLAKLKNSSIAAEVLEALQSQTATNAETERAAKELITALLARPKSELAAHTATFSSQLRKSVTWSRQAAIAALLMTGHQKEIDQLQAEDPTTCPDYLNALRWINDVSVRNSQRDQVLKLTKADQPLEVRRLAVRALPLIKTDSTNIFQLCADLIDDASLRAEAIHTLLQLDASAVDRQRTAKLTESLVKIAEATPIDQRSTDAFADVAQLAERWMLDLPPESARNFRDRLRAVAVRVVRIRTIEEEMRYDLKYFAVEAGRPVEIVLKNEDLMPHNLVITQNGALKEIAFAAAKMAPDQIYNGKQYVPQSDKVLFATSMVPAGKQERMAFTAPAEPGEYPFVCTFPNHWMRMYGVMVVVSDLEAWEKKPQAPADPIGNNRSFVKKWTLADLESQLESGIRGRSAEIGLKLFQEASCQQCHKLRGTGGIVGPDLTDVATRWKGDLKGIMTEILDPSHKVDPKYAVQSVLTTDGKVYSGIIVQEDKDSVSVLSSPDQPQPNKIARDDIDEIIKSSKSIMPVGLLDQYTQDEILEILGLLVNK